jgi:hypothetical protein
MLTSSTDTQLCDLIQRAQRRVVYIAPGADDMIARAIVAKAGQFSRQQIQVCIDSHNDAIRLGFGTMGGLEILFKAAQEQRIILNRLIGVRVGVVLSDDDTMVFSPVPLAVEAPNEERRKHNALVISSGQGADADQILADAKATGIVQLTSEDFQKTKANIDANPPAKYDISRSTRVFNTICDFVELTVTGCEIGRKVLPLPPALLGFAKSDLGKRFKGQMNILGGDDAAKLFDSASITKKRKEIEASFFISVPRYGNLIRKDRRADFEKQLNELKKMVETLQKDVDKGLGDHLKSMKAKLIDVFLPAVKRDLPVEWAKTMGITPSDDQLRRRIEDSLSDSFAECKTLVVKNMQVHVVYKGITYESLVSDDFKKCLQKTQDGRDILGSLHDEWMAAPEQTP